MAEEIHSHAPNEKSKNKVYVELALIKGLLKRWEGMKTGDMTEEDVRGRKGGRKKKKRSVV
jgi:hypothetical protein